MESRFAPPGRVAVNDSLLGRLIDRGHRSSNLVRVGLGCDEGPLLRCADMAENGAVA